MRGFLVVLMAATPIVVALSICGCSEKQRNPMPPAIGSTAAGATSGTWTAPQGPFPRGQVPANYALDPTTQGPEIELVSPDRGAHLPNATSIEVKVKVTDPDGVADVAIANQNAVSLGNDQYGRTVNLSPGVSFVEITARDALGNQSGSCFTLVAGQFHDLDQLLPRCLGASLSQAGIDQIATLIDPLIATLDIGSFLVAANPLWNTAGIEINGLALRHDPPQVSAEGASGGARATVILPKVEFDVEVRLLGGQIATATMHADQAVGVVDVIVNHPNPPVPGQSNLGIEITSADVSFQNFRVTSPGILTAVVLSLLTGPVRDLAETELENLLRNEVVKLMGNQLAGVDTPLIVQLPIPGANPVPQLGFQVKLEEADGDPTTGLGLSLGLKTTAPSPGVPNPTNLVYVQGMTVNPPAGGPDEFKAVVTSDAINTFLHALWLSGATRYVIDGSKMPLTSTLTLSSRLLSPFIPVVKDLAPDPDTPLRLTVSASAPPTVRFGQNGKTIEVTAEAEIACAIDYMDGQPPLEVFAMQVPFVLNADVSIDPNGREVVISGLDSPQVCVDVVREPAADLEDQGIEDFLNHILPWVLSEYKNAIPPIPIPALPQNLQLQSVTLQAANDVLILSGDLR